MKDPTERARFAFQAAARALKELGRTPEEIETGLKDLGEKCGMDVGMVAATPWLPYAGATSFEELDRWAVGQEMREQYDQLNWQLRNIMSNILDAPDLDVTDRAAAITSLAEEFANRADQIPADVADDMDVDLDDLEDDPETASGEADDSADPPSRLARWLRGLKAAGEATPAAGMAAGATKKKLPPWLQKGKKKKAGAAAAAGAKDVGPFGDVGAFTSTKDADGNWRWLAVYSNRYYDREGEVFPEVAHKDYLEWADQDPPERYPELWDWHTPVGLGATGGKGLGMGRADFLDYQDGLAMAAGYWYPEFAHAAESYSARKDLGVSHGYDYAPTAKQADGSYSHFFTFEISPLPRERAANDITLFLPAAGTKEALMNIRPDRRAHLVGVHGEQYVKDLETRLGGVADKLKDSGLSFKDLDAVFADAVDPTQPSAAAHAASGISVPPAAGSADGTTAAAPTPEAYATAIKESLSPAITAAVNAAVQPLAARLEALESGAKDLHAPRILLDLSKSPSNSDASVLDGRTAMVRAAAAGHKDQGPDDQADDGGMNWYAKNGLFGPPAAATQAANTSPVFGDDFLTAAIAAAGN